MALRYSSCGGKAPAESLGAVPWVLDHHRCQTTSMKVTIQLDRSLGGHDQPFTNTDSVCGFVNLNLPHEDAVTRITVELSGMIGSLLLTFTLALELSLSLCL
jgi:hypothetical protein